MIAELTNVNNICEPFFRPFLNCDHIRDPSSGLDQCTRHAAGAVLTLAFWSGVHVLLQAFIELESFIKGVKDLDRGTVCQPIFMYCNTCIRNLYALLHGWGIGSIFPTCAKAVPTQTQGLWSSQWPGIPHEPIYSKGKVLQWNWPQLGHTPNPTYRKSETFFVKTFSYALVKL